MPTSGVLTAVFDPEIAATRLTVDGSAWPSGVRTNLARDPRGTGRWGAANANLSYETAGGPQGVPTWTKYTLTSAVPGFLVIVASSADDIPVTPGDVLTILASVIHSHTPGSRCAPYFTYYDASNVNVGQPIGAVPVGASGVWNEVQYTFPPVPAGAVKARVGLSIGALAGWPIGSYFGASKWLITDAAGTAIGGGYFDGSTPSGSSPTEVVAWTGAANASPSTSTVPAVTTVSVTRQIPGQAVAPVRGAVRAAAVAGYWVGADSEMDLGASLTYTVTGYSATGAVVGSASVVVSTDGAAQGLWVKVPGQADLTCLVPIREVGDVASPTVGGVYQIAGGGAVSQTTAQWSGVESEQVAVVVAPDRATGVPALRAALAAGRVLLLQPVGTTDFDPGWYYVGNVRRANPATRAEAFPQRWFTLDLRRTGIPAGDGAGLPGVSYRALAEKYPTYAEMTASGKTYIDLARGAW